MALIKPDICCSVEYGDFWLGLAMSDKVAIVPRGFEASFEGNGVCYVGLDELGPSGKAVFYSIVLGWVQIKQPYALVIFATLQELCRDPCT